MSIQVEIDGALTNVTKHQLFALAKKGIVTPQTRVIVNGTESTAGKIKELEFGSPEEISQEGSFETAIENSFAVPTPPPFPQSGFEENNIGSETIVVPSFGRFKQSEDEETVWDTIFLDPEFRNFWTVTYLQRFWWWYVLFSYIAYAAGFLTIVFSSDLFLVGEDSTSKVVAVIMLTLGLMVELIIMRIVLEVIMVLFKIAEHLKNIDLKMEEPR